MITFEWKDLAWIAAVIVAIGTPLLAFLRFKLAGDFARTGDVVALSAKVSALEQRIMQMPSHEDIRMLQMRIGSVEQGVAVVGTKVEGVEKIMVRVEHQVSLVSQHLIQEGR